MNNFKKIAITVGLSILVLGLIIIFNGLHAKTQNEQKRKIFPPSNIAPKYSKFFFSVYELDDRYIVAISNNGIGVEFSKDRKCIAFFGIVPVKNDKLYNYLGKEFKLVEKELGQYHIDIGSGFFIPSYITEDGYLICFHVENDYITCVQEYDLFSGEPNTGDGSVC